MGSCRMFVDDGLNMTGQRFHLRRRVPDVSRIQTSETIAAERPHTTALAAMTVANAPRGGRCRHTGLALALDVFDQACLDGSQVDGVYSRLQLPGGFDR